jgi:hypothetical protein
VTRTVCAVLFCTLALLACKDDDRGPTEVIIEIDAETQVSAKSTTLRLEIESRDDPRAPESELHYHHGVHWPFRLALTPRGGDATREYRVTAEAVDERDKPIAAARIVSGFVPGERRRVRIVIEDECIDQPLCEDQEETCHLHAGAAAVACTNAYVKPAQLGTDEPLDLRDLLDDGPGTDAGVEDAGADSAVVDGGPTVDAGPLVPCGSIDGGCDPLSTCMQVDDRAVCGPCPAGFAGEGDTGCDPRLTGLSVTPGELAPSFAADEMHYRAVVPLTAESIAITASASARASLAINGDAAMSGEAWTADLAAGSNALTIEVSAESGASADYELTVQRGTQQAYVKAGNAGTGDHFGAAVAISGETLVIGAPGEDGPEPADDSREDSGAAYVFVREGGGWVEQDQVAADNPGEGDAFGHAVAISGDTLVIGAPFEGSASSPVPDAGAAYVFVRDGSGWTLEAYLKADNADSYDMFGQSVAIDGDTVVVGAPYERSNETGVSGIGDDDSVEGRGAAYVFVRAGSEWSQQAYLKPSNAGAEHLFGNAVAVDAEGGTIAVGAPGDRTADGRGRGSVHVFTRAGLTWSHLAHVKSGVASPGEAFGHSVAVLEDTLVVGTRPDSATTQDMAAGAVHVFDRADGFTEPQKLMASNRDPGDDFGHSVAFDGQLLLVGAPREAGSVRGIHAVTTPADNAAVESGAAYVFAPSGGVWTQVAYLKAGNAESSDRFGSGVGVSAGWLVVGAIDESSGAIGVHADPAAGADNAASDSGAAYVFH